MVRMSDIFKKSNIVRKKEEIAVSRELLLPRPEEDASLIKEVVAHDENNGGAGQLVMPAIIKENLKKFDDNKTEELYNELLSLGRSAFADFSLEDMGKVCQGIERIAEQLSQGNSKLLVLALKEPGVKGDIYAHSVNVLIYSLQIAMELGYDRMRMVELGVSAFLHDIGIINCVNIVNQVRQLTENEFAQVKNHSLHGRSILEKHGRLGKTAGIVASQHHERMDGSGYPNGLKGPDISAFSRIVSVADVYEALTHHRPHRDSISPLETIQEIINHKDKFDQNLIKVMIEKIGIYPAGSLVKLSTGGVAEVIKLNLSFPMRPVVRLVYDAVGFEVLDEKIIDLSVQYTIYIKGPVKRNEVVNSQG